MKASLSVYSTDQGRLCPNCQQSIAACECKTLQKNLLAGDGQVRVRRETKGRNGKGVTLITGLALAEDDLKSVAKTLKQCCGTGGTLKDGVIEIQGDNRERILKWLLDNGYKAKLAGG